MSTKAVLQRITGSPVISQLGGDNDGETVIVDTRKKARNYWGFNSQVPLQFKKLDAGDYSLLGYENQIAVERKTLDDLVASTIWQWERFAKELVRLRDGGYQAIIMVEASLEDIQSHRYHSQATAQSIIGRLQTIKGIYGINTIFGENREKAQVLALEYLRSWHASIKRPRNR